MVGFAVGATNFAPEDYLNPATLSSAFQSAHRLLFGRGIQNLLTPIDLSHATPGLVRSTLQVVTIVNVFALLSQAFLVLVVFGICLLFYLVSRRPSKLACDPDSFAKVMAMSTGQSVQKLFNCHDASDDKALAKALAPSGFTLGWQPGSRHPTVEIMPSKESTNLLETESSTQNKNDSTLLSVQPVEYSLLLGIPLCLGLITTIFSLVFMHQKSIQNNGNQSRLRERQLLTYAGLTLPSLNPIIQQVVLNYIPTALGTVLEPSWVLLTRLVCMMRPLEELRNGNARAQRSLLLNYASVPPPLVVRRAMKTRDMFLLILNFTPISANLLTIALSGLSSQGKVYRGRPTTLQPIHVPNFLRPNTSDANTVTLNSYDQNDAFYVAMANFTNQTSLPSWTSQHYYFLSSPSNASLPDNGGVILACQTPGFGADLECQEMTTTPSDTMYAMTFNANATLISLITSSMLGDGSTVQCTTYGGASGPNSSKNYINIRGDPQGRKALEIVTVMQPLSYRDATLAVQESCSRLIVIGWVRANFSSLGEQQDLASGLSTKDSATVSSTFISCRARPKSAIFKVTSSPSGKILASTQISRSAYDLPSSVDLSSALATTTNNLGGEVNVVWHNDTFASDWSNYLFKTLTSSTAFLDASLPLPSFGTASAVVSETYSRIFAIQMSLQSAQLVPAPPESSHIPAEVLTFECRVFMSETIFCISIAILSLDLVVAVLFYSQAPKPFLPRLPTSIACQIAHFAGSHVIDDMRKAGGDLSELDKHGYRYGYGKYIGKDGRTHVGIERVPYVTKLKSERSWNLRLRRPWWRGGIREASGTTSGDKSPVM
jgi:hypothetical protein